MEETIQPVVLQGVVIHGKGVGGLPVFPRPIWNWNRGSICPGGACTPLLRKWMAAALWA